MPIYLYEHDQPTQDCENQVELILGMGEGADSCPRCGRPIHKIIAQFTHNRSVLSTSNIKDKGFSRWRRKDKGVYEQD